MTTLTIIAVATVAHAVYSAVMPRRFEVFDCYNGHTLELCRSERAANRACDSYRLRGIVADYEQI